MSDKVWVQVISDLIDYGKYNEARTQIDMVQKSDKHAINDFGNVVVLNAKIERQLGKINNALSIIDNYFESQMDSPNDIVYLKLILEKGYDLWFRREPNDLKILERKVRRVTPL